MTSASMTFTSMTFNLQKCKNPVLASDLSRGGRDFILRAMPMPAPCSATPPTTSPAHPSTPNLALIVYDAVKMEN